MTTSREIINDLQEELQNKRNQREALLSQLTLLDARIDKYDTLIANIDRKCLELIDIINPKILAVKQAYDARISANCRSDLFWKFVSESTTFSLKVGGYSSYTTYVVAKNPDVYSYVPYRGLKYYQKPSNRDYGSNLIASFDGKVSSGSTVITILDQSSTIQSVSQVGDTVTDNLDNPIVFSETNLPKIVGFGITEQVGFVTTLVGGISTGSTIFAHHGAGISSVGISTGMFFELVGIVTSTIVGFGTTTFPIIYLDEFGEYETSEVECNSLILDSSASEGVLEETFTVGILTSYPAMFISTSAVFSTSNSVFSIIRQGDIDTNFDYTQSPLEPLNIGTINSSSVGVGHSISLDVSGNPNQSSTWSPSSSYYDTFNQVQVNPEPLIGGGRAEYYVGNLSWPVLNKFSTGLFGFEFLTSNIAPEGTTVTIGSTYSGNILGTVSSYPGVDPNGATCVQLQQNIDNALNDLTNILNQYESQITPLLNSTKALREDRSRKELQGWSILQALGSITEELKRLEVDLDSLNNIDFSPYENA